MDTSNDRGEPIAPLHAWKQESQPLAYFLSRRRFAWISVFVGLFLLLLGYSLDVMPQAYQATVSISMQNGQPSPLSSFLNPGGGAKSYTGVIKSRSAAQFVAQRASVREALNLSSEEAATTLVQESLKVEDINADGLMYLRITIPGPPWLRGKPEQTQRIRETAAQIANAYPEAIRDYMRRSDTDKDLSLLRAAQDQLTKFRRDYDAANAALIAYIRANVRAVRSGAAFAAGMNPSPVMPRGDTTAITGQLQKLYEARGEMEQRKAYLDAEIAGTNRLIQGGTQALASLPAEDEALNMARYNYNAARTDLETLRIGLGDGNPRVVAARERVKLTEKRLQAEALAIRSGKTSAQTKRNALDSEIELVRRQISEVEGAMQGGMEKSLLYDALRREQELRFEGLKQGVVSYNSLSLQTVSVQNRLSVVDAALVPKKGKISLYQILLLDLVGAGLGAAVYVAQGYLRLSRRYSHAAGDPHAA